MKKLLFFLVLPLVYGIDKPKTCPSQQVKNYQDHSRAEVRGMKEGEITEACPTTKKAPKKPAKKRP